MRKTSIGDYRIFAFTLVLLFVSSAVFGALPRAHHIYISGSTAGTTFETKIVKNFTGMRVGQTLRVWYTYADADGVAGAQAESGTTFQWYTYDDNLGTNKQAIAGATAVTFAITAAQVGKHISVEVRPRNTADGFGAIYEFRPWDASNPNPVYTTNGNCGKPNGIGVPVPGNQILSPSGLCSPRSLTWQVQYTGINWQTTGGLVPKIVINWGDGVVETLDPRLFNTTTLTYDVGLYNPMATRADTLNLTNILNQNWRVEQPHIYDYTIGGRTPSATPNERCTYTMTTSWGVGGSSCISIGNQTQKFAVWDNEANTNLGTLDMNHQTGTGGFETGEITDICPFDRTAIRLVDASDFNCTPGGIVENPNPNDQARWVQFVYGTTNTMTTGAAAGQQFTINGTNYTAAQLPVYGPVLYLPATVTTPSAITLDMQMPTTATAGQQMVVTMRTWNTCAAFDRLLFDANGLNPPQAIATFDIYSPAGSVISPLGAAPFYANGIPATRTYTIRIATAPPPPTVTYTANHCDTDADNTFTFTTSHTQVNSTLRWYSDAALTNLQKSSTTSNTFNPITEGTPAMVKATTATTKVVTYYVTEQWPGANGCTSQPQTMTFNITDTNSGGAIDHPNEIGTTSVVAICSGADPPAFTNATSASGGTGGFTYQWESSTTGPASGFSNIASATAATYDPPVTNVTTWFRRRAISGFCPDAYSNVFQIRADVAVTPGSINGAQTVCETSDPTILGSVTAGGAGDGTTYTYQWESSTVGVAGPFNTIVGATSTTYDPPVLPQTTFFRRRVVSGVCVGTNTAYSNVITITVHDINDPGVIGNPQTICSGQDPAALTNVTAASGGDGTNYVYQWQQATALGGPYTDIVGATATTYDPGVLTATTFYRRRVRSPGPVATTCPETFSNVITITVNPLPAGNVSGGGSICSGNPAPDIVFTFTAGTGPWNLVYSISGTNQPIVNNVTSPYTITSPAAGTYRIVSLTDANGCSVTAPSANLTFTAPASVLVGGFPPAFDTAPSLAATSVCSAGAATTDPSLSFSLDGFSTGAGTYVLTYTVDGGSSLTKNFTVNVANGDVSAPLTFSEAAFNNTTPSPHTLRIVSILSPTGCQTVFNTNLSFTVNPLPVGVNKTVTAVCAPATLNIDPFATSVAVGVGGNGVNSTYTWTAAYPPAITGGAASGSGNITGTLANVSGTVQTAVFTVTPTSVVGSCLGSTFTISVPVNPQPVLVAGQTKTICSGASVAYHIQLNPLDLPANTVFNWPDPDGAGPATAGTNVALGAAATLHINDVLTNVTGAPITVNYVVTPTAPAAGCAGAAQTIAITVNPAPVLVNPQSKTICSGSAVAYHIQLTPTDLPANTVFNWPDPDGAGPATAGTNVALGTAATIHINDVLTNTTGSATTVNYVVTPSAGGCAGTARTIPITVNPAPVITAAQTKTICSGEAVNYRVLLTPNNLPAGTTFTWTAPTMSAGGAQGSGGTNVPASNALHLTDVLVNTGSSPITATYAITPTAAGCVGATQNVVITINPLPVANPIVGQGTVCAGTNIILYQVTPNAGSTYTWTIDPLFQVFGGGGTSDFFVLLRFPTVGTGNIRVVETNTFPGKNCSGAANVFPITVAPAPSALTIDGADPVCKGQTGVVYEVPVALFNPASTYTWTASGANIVSATSGVGLRQITVDFGLLASASITVSETSSSGCAGTPVTKNISVSDRPTMTSATATSVCSGSAPSLNFTANLPSTFSWQVITVSGSISGTAVGNTGTGNINQVLTNTSGFSGTVTYRVTPIGTAAPLCAGPTQDVVVTVNPEPVLSLTNKTLCSDQPAQYEIKLAPLNLPAGTTFTWAAPTMSSGGPQGTSGTSIPMGAAGTIHINDTFVNTGTTAITATYVIQATSGLGCNSNQPAASRRVVFTINPKPVGGTDNSPVICSKASPNYSLANNIATLGNNLVAGTTFSWIAASNGNVTGESFGSAQTTATITDVLRNQTNSDQIVVYTVTPTSSNGCAGNPFTVRVTVHPEPKGFNDTPAAICSNNAVGYSLTANVANTGAGANGLTAGTTYDWSGSTNVNVSGTSTTTQTGSTITDVLRNFTTVDQTVVYTVTPKSSNGCVGDPFTVTVTVKPEPVGVNSTVTVCSDVALGVTLTTNPASVAAANYTIAVNPNGLIQSAGTPSAGASKAANEIADDVWTNTTAAAVNVVYTITPVSAANCPGSPFTITVTVNPEPIGVAQTPTRCSDELVNVTLGVTGASVPAATYTIAVNSNGLTFSGTTASAGSAKLANELADDRWTNPGLVPVNVIYTVTPVSAAGCSGNSFTVTVSVLPEPVGANSTLTLCSDDLVNVNLTTSASAIAATTYNIATNANGLTQSAGTVSAGTAKLANELADDRWTNIGLNPVDVVYTVTPVSAAGCAGDPFTVTVTVRPEPSAPNSTVTRCSDELVNTTIATNVSSVAAASFNIAVNANGLTFSGTTASGGNGKLSNELVDDKWTNTGLNPVNVVYTITPVSPLGCLGDPFTITVTVRPEPVGNNSSATVCSDHVVGISLTTNVTSVAAANYTIAVNPNGLIQSAGTASSGVNKAANELADDVWRNTGLTPVNVIYTITPFSAAGCAGDPFTITLTVNPEPVGTSSATTVCGNSSVNVNLTTNVASVAAASFDIAINANGLTLASGTPSAGTGKAATEIADDVWANTGLGPVNVVYTITPVSAAGCDGDPFTVTVTVNPQPVGSPMTATRCSDASVSLTLSTSAASVAASSYNIATNAGGLTQVSGTVSAGTGKAANEISDDVWNNTGLNPVNVVYTINPVSAAGCIGDPFTVTVTINPEPVGSNSSATRCSDQVLGINLSTSGLSVAAATYNIAVNANGLTQSAGTASSGVGKLLNEIADDVWRNTGLAPVNVVYTVTPVSAAGCDGNPFTVTVTINPEPVGANSTVGKCSDEVLGINLTTSATAVAAANYTIAVNANGLTQVAGTNSAGAGKAATEISDDVWRNTTSAPVDVIYTVTPFAATGCTGDPFTVTVTINPEPIGVAQNITRCSDETLSINLGVTGASVAASTYNISVVSNGLTFSGTTASAGTGKLATELADDKWTNTGLLPVNVVYTVNAVSAAGCVGDPFTVTVSVNPEPVGANSAATRCSDDLVGVNLTTSGSSVAAATFNITTNNNGLTQSAGTASAGTGKASNELADDRWTNTGLNPVDVIYTIVPVSAAGCAGDPFTVTITVRPEPVGANSTAVRCSDELLNLTLSTSFASVAAASYNIAINPNGLTFSGATASGGAAKLANELMDDKWTNNGLNPVDVVYTVTPVSAQGCLGDPFTVTVTIRPEPVGVTATTTVCSDVVVGGSITTTATSVGASVFTIAVNPNGLIQSAGTNSAGSNKLANEIANDAWRNTGLNPVDVIYTITPFSAAGCAGDDFTITVTVNPEPVGSNSTTTICANAAVSVNLTTNPASVAAASYTIAVNSNGLTLVGGTASAGSGKAANELADDRWSNTGLGPVNVIYTVTPVSAAGCFGDPFTVTVTVNPEPVGTPVTTTRCSDDAVAVPLTTSATAVSASSFNITTNSNGLTQVGGSVSAGTGKAANELVDDVWRNTGLLPVDVVYTIVPVSASGCSGAPFLVTVTINPKPVGSSSTLTKCSDEVLGVSLTTSVTSVAAANYNITVAAAGGLTLSAGTASAGNGKAATELADDVWRNTGLSPANVVYTIVPVSAAGCLGDAFTVTATIRPEPVGTNSTLTRCSDVAVGSNITTSGASVAATSFDIAVNANGLTQSAGTASAGLAKLATEIADDVWTNTGLNPVDVVYTITPYSAAGCAGDPFTITVTVNPEPVGAASTITQCSDVDLNITLTTSVTSVSAATYVISIVSNGLTYSGPTPSAGSGKLASEIADDRWTNTGLVPVDVVYTITPVSASGCSGDPFDVTVTINPEPVGSNGTATRCSDDLVNFTLSTSAAAVSAATYNISVNANGLTFSGTTPSGGNGKAANELVDDAWTNVGLIPVNVIYTVTPVSAAGCEGNPFTVNVTVRPEPVGFDSNVVVCSDEQTSFTLSTNGSSVAATTYNITVNANGLTQSAGSNSQGSGKVASELFTDAWRNTTNAPVDVIYTVIPVSAGPAFCQGDPFVVTVTVNPEPVGVPTTATKCSDEVLGIAIATTGGSAPAATFNITVNAGGLTQSGGTPSAGTGKLANEIADDQWNNVTNAPVVVVYTIVPITAAPESCQGDSFQIAVTINPEPVGQNVNISDCSTTLNYNIQTANIDALGNGLASVFTYVVTSSDEIAVPTPPALDRIVASNSPITDSFTNLSGAAVDVTYTITPFNAASPSCGGTPFTYTVRISPKPVGVSNTKAAVCSDVAYSFDPQNDLSPSVASTFTWTVVYDAGLSVRVAKSPKTGTLAETLTNTTAAVLNAVYTVIPTAAGSSCVGDPFTVTVPILPEPVVASNLDLTQCSDVAYGQPLNTNGVSVAATTYDITAVIEPGLTGVASTGTGLLATALNGDVFNNVTSAQLRVTYTVIPRAANSCYGDAKDVIFKVNPEPVLAPQVIPDICSNNIDNPSTTGIVLGTNGSSITASSYTLTTIQYKLVSAGAFGAALPAGVTTGANATAPSTSNFNIVKNDKFTNIASEGVMVKYTVTASSPQSCVGNPVDYIITVNPQPTLDPSLSPTPVCSDLPSSVTLGVDPGPPASVAAASYIIRSINFTGLTPGPTNTGTGTGKAANAIFNDSYTNVTANPIQATYSIAPVSGVGCVGLNKDVALTINPSPNLDVLPAVTCNDGTSGIVFATTFPSDPNGVPAANYDVLSILADAGLTPNGGNVAAQNGVAAAFVQNDRFHNTTLTTKKVRYSVRPVSAANCKGPAKTVELTVEPIIEIVPNPAAASICGDGLVNTNIQLTSGSVPSAGGITFSYSATASSALVSGFGPIVSNLTNPSTIGDLPVNNSNVVQTITYTVTPSAAGAKNGAGCVGTPVPIVVTVEPKPKLTIPSTKTICENDAVNIVLTSPTVPSTGAASVSVDMIAAPTGNVTGFVTPATFANGATLGDILVNNDPTNSSVEYKFTPKFGTCVGSQVSTIVTVSPRPVITPIANFDICSGEIFNPVPITVDTDPASTFIQWTVAADPDISGESGGAGNSFSQVLFNNSANPKTLTYTLTARNIGNVPACNGSPVQLLVGVYPVPKMVGLPPSVNVCNNATNTVNLNSSATGTTYNWIVDNNGNPDLPVIANGGGSSSIVQTYVNNGTSLGSYQYQVTPTVIIPSNSKNCVGNPGIMVVNVAPPIVGQLYSSDGDATAFICKGSKDFVFFDFGGLPLFEYTYSDGVAPPKTVSGKGPIDIVTVQPTTTTTYTLLSVKDGFGCVQNVAGQSVTVNVGFTDASFSINGPAIACSPFQVKFQHNEVAGVNYTWKWFDGGADSTYLAASNVNGQLIPHTFKNPAPRGTVTYKVFLEAFLDDNYPGACRTTTNKSVQVYPTVAPAVFPDKTVICSDETITFVNSSQGVTQQNWFYRVQGSTTPLDPRTTASVTYKIPNTTSSNPIVYEVVYQSTNGNCPAADVVTPITVYRGIDAHFSHTSPTVFVGGHSFMTLTNDSQPVDGTDFRYEWDFGANATPLNAVAVGPTFNLDYSTPGPKELVVRATNIVAEAAGLSCFDEYRETITITVPPLIADFTAIPLAACFPTDITVTENKATGDKFSWRVIDAAGTAAQSNAVLPVFKIPAPGKYTVELVTSNSFTGDQKTATKDVIIYDLPMASFDVRPGVVYVPDTELSTFNFSDGANAYVWDFGDGTTADTKEPKHTYKVEGVYDVMLIAQNDHGNGVVCADTLTRKVTAKQGGVTRVPNAFTPDPSGPSAGGAPNSNTFNDVFLPQVKGAEEFNMQVFDRWGNLVFESNNANVGWDGYDRHGRLMPAGVYVYKLTLRLSDGQRTTQIGDITMIR